MRNTDLCGSASLSTAVSPSSRPVFTMRHALKKLRDERGQVIVLTVLSMTAIMGFLALAIDVGQILYVKR